LLGRRAEDGRRELILSRGKFGSAFIAPGAFEEVWDYRTLNGTPQRQRRREILAHLFNHETHHRGQAHAILTVLGVAEPEPLDLLIMQRDKG
jgi:uncharacterized damage-inducible protein DinB